MINPKRGPKKQPIVSIKDKIPIWLRTGSQKILIKSPQNIIKKTLKFKLRFYGKKFNRVFWECI